MAKILIVDDEPIPCRMLHCFLMSEGHDVRTALDADEAIEAAREFRPDLLIADWLLKDKTGLDVALAVRDALPQARIIFTTGLPTNVVAAKARAAGATRIIEKPFDLETLGAAIREAMGSSAVERCGGN
jgi:DNA-binding response OmpR family regulator